MMLVSYRLNDSDATWRAGILHDQAVVDASAYVSSDGRLSSSLSSLMTLEPSDILATGTPSGVGFKRTPPLFLQDGDVVEVEIERIGLLRNPVKQGDN